MRRATITIKGDMMGGFTGYVVYHTIVQQLISNLDCVHIRLSYDLMMLRGMP